MRWSSAPVLTSQIRQVPSSEADARRAPSGDHVQLRTADSWLRTICADSAAHTLTVRSSDAVASRRLSGDQAQLFTLLSCPRRVHTGCPLASQILAVWSSDVVANRAPSGDQVQLLTQL